MGTQKNYLIVPKRQFFRAPKTYVKTDGRKYLQFYAQNFSLSNPMMLVFVVTGSMGILVIQAGASILAASLSS